MDEFDLITDALGAVRTIQGVYGTTHDGATRIDEVVQILRLRDRRWRGEPHAPTQRLSSGRCRYDPKRIRNEALTAKRCSGGRLAAMALARDPHLDSFADHVEDSGEGRWTINAAIEEAVPTTVLSAALCARFRSRQSHSFADKMLSAMRKGFGGHQEPTKI